MGITDWNWKHPVELQDVAWDCAAASTAWALQACGHPYSEYEVAAGLGPGRISPAYGLLDASGAGIVAWLAEIGIGAENDSAVSWTELIDAAGYQPMIAGGRGWYHWTGVRISNVVFGASGETLLALANPSPGWKGIDHVLDLEDFADLGPWSAVWFTSW
jgi:hypothetical protein